MAKTPNKKKNVSKQNPIKKIDVAGLVKKSLFLVVAMAWAFILGVLVGKGYKPENAVPEIARIMPVQPEVSPAQPKTLTAEELGYYDRLKNNHPAPQNPQHAKAARVVHATAKPAPKAVRSDLRTTAPARKQTSPTTSSQSAQKTPRFSFTYQIAALKNETDAIRLQQQVIRLGIAAYVTRTQEGWNRVFIRIKGTDKDAGTALAKLKTIGGSKPFLRAKKTI